MTTAPSNQRIIGGGFGLEQGRPKSPQTPAFLAEPCLLLATARSAFALLEGALRPRQVWLPSYLCAAMLEALPEHPRIRFYGVDGRFRPADDGWIREIRRGDLAVFIDYFGFTVWGEHGREARRAGAWVVEDACQALLNDGFSEHAHYVVASPRKFVGVPDGGILLARKGAELPGSEELPPPSPAWWLDALAASQLRGEFDRHGGGRAWFPLFQKTDAMSPCQPMRMSELSALLLRHRIDYEEIGRRRRENYRFLASELADVAIFPDLGPGVVPLGFPVRIRDRDRLRQALFDAEIYPAVHWPIADVVPQEFETSHRLAGEIMTLPCDQRYARSDMERILTRMRALKPATVETVE